MGNLSNIIPQEPLTTTAIYDYWKTRGSAEKPRQYLGMSSIGKACDRALWYGFRHAAREEFEGRLYRLFNRGHREEATFAEELRGIGCTVLLEDENDKQFGFIVHGGHYRGHMDAAILGVPEAPKTWHVGEFKTHSSKSFADLVKNGVEKSKPEHFAQMQAYMQQSGMTRALYVAVNKDTDEIYTERIRYDAKTAQAISDRALRIITATQPPERIASRRDDYRCRFCAAKSLCHGSISPEPAVPLPSLSCRQCCHATPELDGNSRWSCSKHNKDLSPADQAHPCKHLLLIPGLVTFADPVDSHKTADGSDVIEFRNHSDGAIWHHGPDRDAGHYAAADLVALPVDLIGATPPKVKVSPAADGTTQINADLLARYSEGADIVKFGASFEDADAFIQDYFEGAEPSPINTDSGDGWNATEFDGGILVLASTTERCAEIRIHAHPDNDRYQSYVTKHK